MIQTEQIAKQLYETYSEGVGGVAFNGDKLPNADDFFADKSKEKQVMGWHKTAESQMSAYNLLRECALNLGHPAYNQSSSITIGIDNLREKALDFLQIPKD